LFHPRQDLLFIAAQIDQDRAWGLDGMRAAEKSGSS
jgi:hypothetical protein